MHGTLPDAVFPQRLPRAVRDSALMKAGGCAVVDDFPGADACQRLLSESRLCLHGAALVLPDHLRLNRT